MIIRSLDSDSDWKFGKGKSDFLSGMDALQENIETRLKSWKGDCFFDGAEGVDYNNLMDVGTKSLLDRDVKRVIGQSEGVIVIKSFKSSLNRDTRGYSATAGIITYYGPLKIEV